MRIRASVGVTPSKELRYASVCVCHPLIAKRNLSPFCFSPSSDFPFNRRGPEAHRQDSGQRTRLSAEREAIWDRRAVRISAFVGVTPSKKRSYASVCVCHPLIAKRNLSPVYFSPSSVFRFNRREAASISGLRCEGAPSLRSCLYRCN